MTAELTERARAFLETAQGSGPRALWLSWIESAERDSGSKHEVRVKTRALSRLRAVMTMAQNKTDAEKEAVVEFIGKSAAQRRSR